MIRHQHLTLVFSGIFMLAGGCAQKVEFPITNGQGEIAGEVTTNSVILQSRLTRTGGWVDGDLPGAPGVARFEISTNQNFAGAISTEWLSESSELEIRIRQEQRRSLPTFRFTADLEYGLPGGSVRASIEVRGREQVARISLPQAPRGVTFDPDGWILKEIVGSR